MCIPIYMCVCIHTHTYICRNLCVWIKHRAKKNFVKKKIKNQIHLITMVKIRFFHIMLDYICSYTLYEIPCYILILYYATASGLLKNCTTGFAHSFIHTIQSTAYT